MGALACKIQQKLTSFQASVTFISGLLHKQEVKTSFQCAYRGASKRECIFCCLYICANAVMSVTAATALHGLDRTCVLREYTQRKLVPRVCQQKMFVCRFEDGSICLQRWRWVHVWLYLRHLSVTSVCARLERQGTCISKEERGMGAAAFVYEGNMNALAVNVYAGCMLTFRVKTCFSAGGKIHATYFLMRYAHSPPNTI